MVTAGTYSAANVKVTGREERPGKTLWYFPGWRGVMKGKKTYSRRRMFERIHRLPGIKLTPQRPA